MINTINEYDPQLIERQAQQYWEKNQSFRAADHDSKEPYYVLAMFPYPSGTLHMGHVRNYTLGDVIARYQRMQGKNVMQPIGWDAFGLPAENAAIKHKTQPAKWTYANIATMRQQFKRLGNGYDWQREFATCDPNYYRWEQWFFIQLYKKGLVYKKNALVNWDPVDQTVLANEQVVDGCGWRSGAPIERKEIAQWFIKITDYAEELLHKLDHLPGWPEQVKTMQRNWIGRSQGIEIHFPVANTEQALTVFTTRPDTLMGVTYLAIAADHPLAKQAAQQNTDIQLFIDACQHTQVAEAQMATLEKKGIHTNLFATHPISGKPLPIWIANFVLMEYGSGAVMAVPAHDQRDWEFAHQYNLPIQPVISLDNNETHDLKKSAYTGDGTLIHSDQFNGLDTQQAITAISDHLVDIGKGERQIHYRLRDWGISRQRYWGTPIPMVNCANCGIVPVAESDLPVILPENIEFTGNRSPLHTDQNFIQTICPTCGAPAQRETDTFDTFVESSWYYARFACPDYTQAMLDKRAKYWLPVNHYIGGIEHAIMHLLYARFFHKLMRDMDLVDSDEPFTRLLTQGMVLKDGHKMSKSKGNVVDPNDLIAQYGADTVRLFIIFAAPPEQSLEWSQAGVEGAHRFLRRLWQLGQQLTDQPSNHTINWDQANPELKQIRQQMHKILAQANQDYTRYQFNTVVSAGMKLARLISNLVTDKTSKDHLALAGQGFAFILCLLAPITPHICHVLWQQLHPDSDILSASWPQVDKTALVLDTVKFTVQINGKRRAEVDIPADADNKAITEYVLANASVQHYVKNTPILKTIVVNKRHLVNLVI